MFDVNPKLLHTIVLVLGYIWSDDVFSIVPVGLSQLLLSQMFDLQVIGYVLWVSGLLLSVEPVTFPDELSQLWGKPWDTVLLSGYLTGYRTYCRVIPGSLISAGLE